VKPPLRELAQRIKGERRMTERRIEAPVDDAIEQEQTVGADEDTEGQEWPAEMPLDADEADAAEQGRTVGLDEDDYR